MKEGKVFKRILAIALVVVMTITMMPFGVFAEGEACTHETYTTVKASAATCTEPALSEHVECDTCHAKGKVVSNAFAKRTIAQITTAPALGHSWNDATCIAPKTCTVCNATEGAVNPNNHADAAELKANTASDATCTTDGKEADEVYKCCGVVKTTGTTITATGHAWNVATCTLAKTCGTCGATEGEALGHNWENATCTAAKTCKTCGVTEGSALSHNYSATDGKCDDCDAVCPHSNTEDFGGSSATCTEYGQNPGKKCSLCKYVVEAPSTADPLGHNLTKTAAKEPKCAEAGNIEYWTCSRCNKLFNAEAAEERNEITLANTVVSATGHDETGDFEVVSNPTCTVAGSQVKKCKTCGEVVATETINALGHDETGEFAVVTNATCTTPGSEEKKCKTCNEVIATKTINALGHDTEGVEFEAIKVGETTTEHGKKCKTCGEYTAKAAHAYTTLVKRDLATCVTVGLEITKCVCGEEKTETLPMNDNHDFGAYTETKAPTCTEKGEKERACKREGCEVIDKADVDPLGHDMDEVAAKEATCEEAGNNKYYACDRCDKFFKDEAGAVETTVADETIAKGEHKFTKYNVIKDATCEANAIEKATCDVCEEATHERGMPGTMIAHTFKDYKSDGNATCKVDGTMTAVCDMCKEAKDTKTEVDSYKTAPHTPDADGVKCTLCGAELVCLHVYSGEKLITKTPTCTEKGQKAIVCSKCKANKPGSEEEIAATGHAWDEGEVTKPATCKEKGSKKFKCNNKCGETKTEEIAVAPHDYKKEITHATCTEDGYTTFTCAMCGSHYVDDAIKAYGHMFDLYFYDEGSATCYQDGTKTAECANGCGTKNTVADPGSKTDHEMTDFTIITAATCTTDGEEEAKCFYHEKCGYSELVPVDALGHDIPAEFVTITEPTCTEKGLKTKTCTRCPETVASEEIPALGHDIAADYTIDVAATCTTDGKQSKHCSRCDYKDGEVAIPATGHDHKATGEGTTATCTEPGKAVYVCANGCGDTYSEDNVPALGHDYAYVSDNNATCEADGTKTGKCIRCDATNTIADEGSKLGHTLGTPVIEPASEEKGGLITTKCANCDYAEVEEIAMIDGFKLKYETVVYDGKYKRPSLTITDAEGVKLVKGEDYVLDLPAKDECINAGTYTYTVTFIGNYEGEKTLTYKIVPGKTSKIVASTTKQTYITLKWSAVKGADGYRVYVQTSSGGWKKLATVKGKTTYKVTDLKAGTQYSFAVKAFSKSEDGETTIWATDYTTKTLKTLPGKTSKITVKTNKSAVKLTWKEVKSAEGYRVYVKTAKGGWKTVATVKGGKTTYTIKDLKANTTYEYAVKAYYKDGSATVWSNQYTTVKAKTAK